MAAAVHLTDDTRARLPDLLGSASCDDAPLPAPSPGCAAIVHTSPTPPASLAPRPWRPFLKPGRTGTGIAWATDTWNPWIGCSKCSRGCENCYAVGAGAACSRRKQKQYDGLTRRLKSGRLTWSGEVRESPAHIFNKPLSLPAGSLVFTGSMSDFGHPKVTDDMRLRALAIIRQRRDIAFRVLTKRIEELAAFLRRTGTTLPDNVWLGVTVEAREYIGRIDILRTIPAAVRFLSVEPMLDDVAAGGLDLTGIDWVIAGGESGKEGERRPMSADWVRRLRDACVHQNVAFFMKQWGYWRNNPAVYGNGKLRKFGEYKKLDPHGNGGALLDRVLWREMPAVYWQRWAPLYKPKRHLRVVQGSPDDAVAAVDANDGDLR